MKIISRSTFLAKKAGPVLVVVFLGIFFIGAIMPVLGEVIAGEETPIVIVIMLLTVIVVTTYTYFHYKKVIWPLIDEVYDEGHQLRFKKGSLEQSVRFEDIASISYDKSLRSLDIITHNNGDLGTELSFLLPTDIKTAMSREKHPLYLDLMKRFEATKK